MNRPNLSSKTGNKELVEAILYSVVGLTNLLGYPDKAWLIVKVGPIVVDVLKEQDLNVNITLENDQRVHRIVSFKELQASSLFKKLRSVMKFEQDEEKAFCNIMLSRDD